MKILKASPWYRRIYDLRGAMGWSHLETAQHLGFKTGTPLTRILKGGKPKVSFLLMLQKLETVYAREIETFIRHQRHYGRFRSKRLHLLKYGADGDTRSARPDDLRALGKVEADSSQGRFGSDDGGDEPPRVVYWTDPRRYKRKNNKVGPVGPPTTEPGGQSGPAKANEVIAGG